MFRVRGSHHKNSVILSDPELCERGAEGPAVASVLPAAIWTGPHSQRGPWRAPGAQQCQNRRDSDRSCAEASGSRLVMTDRCGRPRYVSLFVSSGAVFCPEEDE